MIGRVAVEDSLRNSRMPPRVAFVTVARAGVARNLGMFSLLQGFASHVAWSSLLR